MQSVVDRVKTLLHALFVQQTDHGGVQFIRYGFVAIIAFLVDFGLLFVLTKYAHLHYLVSATTSFTISAAVNYWFSTMWVFAKRDRRERKKEIALFFAVCVVALLLNDLFIWFFTAMLGIYYLISKLLTVAIVFFWSFGARRILFRAKSSSSAVQ